MSRRPLVGPLALALCTSLLVSTPALAQQPSASPSAASRNRTGSLAQWEIARRAYAAGNFVRAAQLLSDFLDSESSSSQRSGAEQLLANAEAQVGRLRIQSDTVGAEIFVDGQSIGNSPFEREWYVAPGEHVVEARANQSPSQKVSIRAVAGGAVPINFRLRPPRGLSTASLRAANLMGTEEGQRPPTDPLDAAKTLHTVLLSATGTAALIGLATGIGFRVAATNRDAEARTLRAQLLTIPEPSNQPCSSGTVFETDCKRMARLHQLSYDDQRASDRAFLVFGAAGALTLAYSLLVAFDSDEPPRSDQLSDVKTSLVPLRGGLELGISARF